MGGYQTGRQQLVDDRVKLISQQFSINTGEAFLRFVHMLVTMQSLTELDPADVVDGNADRGIDAITFVRDGDHVQGYIFQTKYVNGFSSTELLKVKNGLDWIFVRQHSDVETLENLKFIDKIDEYRSLLDDVWVSNISITVVFATRGQTSSRPTEFRQEEQHLREMYETFGFESFRLLVLGADELVDYLYARERHDSNIAAELRIKYDRNVASLVEYEAEEIKGLVCTASAQEIARIVNDDKSGMIFDANIRQFLGLRSAVNTSILETCQDTDVSHLFWFLNNGITIVCDDFTLNQVADPPKVTLKNMQIVNGCQTASSLALADSQGKLRANTHVLLRIYRAPNTELASRIVQTTNSQNKLTTRNLRANDPIQIDLANNFSRYGYYYERKPGQFDRESNIDVGRIAPNEKVAQAYLAIVLKEPSTAFGRSGIAWEDRKYKSIFRGGPVEPYIFAWQLYECVARWLQTSPEYTEINNVPRKVARSGSFFVARIASCMLRKSDSFDPRSFRELQMLIASLDKSPTDFTHIQREAFDFLVAIISEKPRWKSDLEKTFKLRDLDTTITTQLKEWLKSHEA